MWLLTQRASRKLTERPKKDVVAFSEHVRHHNGATLFLFVLLIAPSGRANSPPTPSVPGEIGVFAETVVQSIPPELAADLLIQIADSQASVKGTSNWRERLYEHAFQLAGSAQEPVKLTIVPGGPTDSRDGMLTQGFRYGIDGMS